MNVHNQKQKKVLEITIEKKPCFRCKGTRYRVEQFNEGRTTATGRGESVTGIRYICVACISPQCSFETVTKREPYAHEELDFRPDDQS